MRITNKLLKLTAKYTSTYSENYEFHANHRNGYVALDVYIKNGALIETLFVGTSKEVYNYLNGMINGARYKTMIKPF